MSVWALVLGAALLSAAIRLAPELWLRGRAPPGPLARTLPWLPIAVAGTFVGLLHLGAAPAVRTGYLIAAIPAALTLLWRRTFYVPLLVGAATLAALRHFTTLS